MNLYFYHIHVWHQDHASFGIPVYIEASDLNSAKTAASDLLALFENNPHFQLTLDPSEPIYVSDNLNKPRLDNLVNQVGTNNSVKVNLPVDYPHRIFQKAATQLAQLEVCLLGIGTPLSVYSL